MKRICILILGSVVSVAAQAETPQHRVELLCHRTANSDVPENTLESLEQAALLGCDVIELDIRRTLDGKLVLNHDGILEHLTDGIGTVDNSYYDDLRLRDAGAWMGDRFTGLRIPTFEDALRIARERHVFLILDIKTPDELDDIAAMVKREDMMQHVQFPGTMQSVKQLYPEAKVGDASQAWVGTDVTAEQVKSLHRNGKKVIANFSALYHDVNLAEMKAAVAAGVDGINVDYPRIGADAVGRPVELKLKTLVEGANAGDSAARAKAILELSKFRSFPTQSEFTHWLLDPDDHVSRAAAVALVIARPKTPPSAFATALKSENADARANAAWAMGMLSAPSSSLLPLLHDKDTQVLRETLMALGRMPGTVSAEALLPFFHHADPMVRGAAAVALARHQPEVAVKAVPAQLQQEMKAALVLHTDYVRRGRPLQPQDEVDKITGLFKCQVKMVDAIAMLHSSSATAALETFAFHPTEGMDFSFENDLVSEFQLWDRISADPRPAVKQLGSSDVGVADRTEWMLIQAGPAVLPEVRKALTSDNVTIRARAIQIVAWQGDADALPALQAMQKTDAAGSALIWAIEKIKNLQPTL